MQVSRAVAQQRGSSLIPEAAYTDHDVVHVHMRFGRQVTMIMLMMRMRMVNHHW